MRQLLAALMLLGISFYFNEPTGTGFGFENTNTFDAIVIVREGYATYCYSNGQHFVLSIEEHAEVMMQVAEEWKQNGYPEILWKIIRVLPEK